MFVDGKFQSFGDSGPMGYAGAMDFSPQFQNTLPNPPQVQVPDFNQYQDNGQSSQNFANMGKGAGDLFGMLNDMGAFGGESGAAGMDYGIGTPSAGMEGLGGMSGGGGATGAAAPSAASTGASPGFGGALAGVGGFGLGLSQDYDDPNAPLGAKQDPYGTKGKLTAALGGASAGPMGAAMSGAGYWYGGALKGHPAMREQAKAQPFIQMGGLASGPFLSPALPVGGQGFLAGGLSGFGQLKAMKNMPFGSLFGMEPETETKGWLDFG